MRKIRLLVSPYLIWNNNNYLDLDSVYHLNNGLTCIPQRDFSRLALPIINLTKFNKVEFVLLATPLGGGM